MRQKHFFSILLMLLCLGISNVWAADTNTPTSGSQYRLKAVKTGTGAGTYYMVAPTSSGLGGATTTEADGTVFTFTQESSKWYVTFTNNSTTYYMYEHSDNGKVSISTKKTEVAIGTNGNFIKIGSSKWIQFNYNSGNCRMGAYSSSQTGVVLSSVAAANPTLTITPKALDFGSEVVKGASVDAKTFVVKGANLTKGLKLALPNAGFTLDTDTITKAEAEANTGKTITVTPVTTTAGTFNGDITIGGTYSDFAGKDSTVALTMTVLETYAISAAEVANGSFSWEDENEQANATPVLAGTLIQATATPASGDYVLDSWDIYYMDGLTKKAVTHTDGLFEMPAFPITISGSFRLATAPALDVSKSAIDFGEVDINSEPDGQSFTIKGSNLTNGITLLTGNENEAFTLSATSFTKDEVTAENGVTITVTPKPTYAGTVTNKVYVTWDGGTEQKIVDLSMTVNKLNAGLAWKIDDETATAATAIMGESNTLPTLAKAEGATVVYSSTNASAATIDAGTGEITLQDAGETVIKATISDNATYADAEVSYTLTVKKKYTANWIVNGVQVATETAVDGTTFTQKPTPAATDFTGKQFVGWATAAIDSAQAEAPATLANPTTMQEGGANYYAVFAIKGLSDIESLAQTLQFDTWTYSGSTTDKSSYRLFGNNAYIQSSSFDLGTLSTVKVFGGTFGGQNDYKSFTIGDGTHKWKDGELSGTGNAKEHSFTDGAALSGTGSLYITSTCGDGTNNGLRISKVEIYTKGVVYSGYATNTYAVNVTEPATGTLVVKNGDNAITSGAKFAKGIKLTVEATPADDSYQPGVIKVMKGETDVTASVLSGTTLTVPDYAVTVSVTFTKKPFVTLAPKALDFETGYKGVALDGKTFTITGSYLTGNDALTITLPEAGYTSEVTSGSLTPSEGAVEATVTVTPVTTTVGTYNGDIVINGGGLGADTAKVAATLKVSERVWTEDGADHDFGTILQYGDKPEAYEFTLKGVHLTQQLVLSNSSGTDYYSFTPDAITPDAEGKVNQKITVELKFTDNVPSTMTNVLNVRSNGDGPDGVYINLLTLTTAVTMRRSIEATTDANGNTFEWKDQDENENPQYGIPGTTVITATPKPAPGYNFVANSWDIYYKEDAETKFEHTNGVFTLQNYNTVISGSFVAVPDVVVSESALATDVDINSTPADGAKSFTVSGANLTANVTLALDGEKADAFELSATELAKEDVMAEGGVTVTVTPKSTATAGTFVNTITISSTGAEDETVDLLLTVNKLAAGLSWNAEEVTAKVDSANTFPTLTNGNSLAVTYSSSNTDVAAFTDASDFSTLKLLANGDVTIKATTAGDATYAADEVSFTLHVLRYYTVNWYINGEKKATQVGLPEDELAGIPDATLASNGAIYGKVFKGWAEAAIEGEVAAGEAGIVEAPTKITAANKDYYAVYALETPGEATNYDVFATTSLGSTNTVTSGFAVSAEAAPQSGYYQDGNGTERSVSVMVSNTETQIIPAQPTKITLTANLGGGTAKDPLDNSVYAVLLDADGKAVGDPVLVTTKITDKEGSNFVVAMPTANYADVRGARVLHVKESGYNVRYYALSLTYTTAGPSTFSKYATSGPKILAVPEFSPAEGTYTEAKDIVLTAAVGDIYYTLDGTEPTTSSTKYTAAIKLNTFGEYTIKAFAYKGEDGSRSSVVSATYTMKIPFDKVSDLIQYVTDNSLTELTNVTVTGIISQVDDIYNGAITYWISDDGQTNAFEVYRGKGIGGANFDAVTDLSVGDKVTVNGNYTLYNEVHEFASFTSKLVSHVVAEVSSVEIGGDADTKAYENGEAFAFTGLTATAVYNTGYEKDVTDEDDVWAADPATIGANTTSVSVTATYDEVASTPKVVTGITVNKHAVTFADPANGTLVVKNGGTPISSGAEFVKGTELTVEATPADGYVLATLTAGETDIKESKSFAIGTADVTVAATFVPKYYLKNGWESGTWSWKEMTYVSENNYILENVVFGGEGFNWRQGESGDGTWVALSDEKFLGDAIGAWDNVTLALNPSAGTITATLNTRAAVEFGGSWTQDWSVGKITAVLSSDGTYATAKKELTKDVWYNFKPVIGGHWLGCSAGATGITRSSNSASGFVTEDGDNHIYFQADKTGEYLFTWYFITRTCQVTFPGDIPSALDNTADEVKAVKFIENGQIFILRGEKVYTVDGQLVK